MTKSIRVENADTSEWKVVVQVWQKGIGSEPDVMSSEHKLDSPADMITEYVHGSQYLVVKEVG